MKKLLNIEYLKISNYKTGKFFIIAYFAILCFVALSLSQNITILGLKLELDQYGIFDFPNVWHFITYFADFAKLFLAIIIITTITNEFSYGTMKQNLIDGLSKKEFIWSKTLTTIILSLASTIFVTIIAITLGLIFTEGPYSIFYEFEYIPIYFLKLITFFSLCIFLSIWVRKSAFVFAMLFIWWIVEAVLRGVEMYVRGKILNKDMVDVGGEFITNYLPLSSMSMLIPSPFKRIDSLNMVTKGQLYNVNIEPIYVILCVLYFLLFIYLSYRLIQKRDL